MSNSIPDWQASQLAQLLDALGSTPTMPDELRTLTWLASWEPSTVERMAALFSRCRDEVASLEWRNRALLRKLAEVAPARLTPEQADAAHAKSCSCGDRAAHEAEDGSDYTLADLNDAVTDCLARIDPIRTAIEAEQDGGQT